MLVNEKLDAPAGVTQLGYIGIGVSDMEAWTDFACNVLGLQINGVRDDGSLLLRMDNNHHRFEILPTGEDDLVFHGWEVKDAAALARAFEQVRDYGIEVREGTAEEAALRKVLALIKFNDPAGVPTEIYYGAKLDHKPFISPRGVNGFSADGLGLGHIVMQVEDADAYLKFYTQVLGARISDIILFEQADKTVPVNFLHVNPRHHSLAIGPRPPGGKLLNHFMIETDDLDDVGIALALAKARNLPTGTLGRHTNDKMLSFYVQTPSGFRVEYGFGGVLIEDEATWLVQHYTAASIWGHERP